MANSTASFTPSSFNQNLTNRNEVITMWDQIKDLYCILKATSSYSDIPGHKTYRALLSQQAVSSPTATVLFNNTGVTPAYKRSSMGNYEVTASNLFYETASCYRVSLPFPYQSGAFSASAVYAGRSGSDNYGYITIFNASSSARCDEFNNLFYEIIVQG